MADNTQMEHCTEDTQNLTRGYKKKARTRQALLNAAVTIYAEKGVSELLLNELADMAGVSNGTVYNYFSSREAVLEAVGMELADQYSHQITRFSTNISNGAERLCAGVRMFIRHAKEEPVWAGAVVNILRYDSKINTAVAGNLRRDLQSGLRQGSLHYSNEDTALVLVVSATTGMLAALLDGHAQPDCDVLLAEMLLLGLGVNAAEAKRIARLPLPEVTPLSSAPTAEKRKRGRPRKTE